MSLASVVSGSLQLIWPARCAACDQLVPDDVVFCGPCNLSVNPLYGVCSGCALPRHDDPRQLIFDGKHCGRCLRVPLPFASAAGGFEYGEALAEAIVRMKHGGRRHLAPRLARMMVPALAEMLGRARISARDLLMPVPLHPRRLAARGFNQALELARWALDYLSRAPALVPNRVGEAGLSPAEPVAGGAGPSQGPASMIGLPRLERNVLQRIRDTRELGHAGPILRAAEVAGAFAVDDEAQVRGRRVLLIDDVFTTGATFSACAAALLSAGADAVHVFALARAV